jgi:cytochrome c551/c552
MKHHVLPSVSLLSLLLVVSCSQRPERPPATLAELEQVTAAKNAHEVAAYIFDNYSCKNCHTVASGGKFGYTPLGAQLKNKSEGCIALLTTVSRIVTMPEANRTAEQKEKLAHFSDYGCTACHRISFGSIELTEVGAKLKTMHLACTDVQRVLN